MKLHPLRRHKIEYKKDHYIKKELIVNGDFYFSSLITTQTICLTQMQLHQPFDLE